MRSIALLVLFPVLFSGCFGSGATSGTVDSSSSSSSSDFVSTPNVNYTGIIRALDPARQSEGTHRLFMGDMGTVFLTASDQGLDLDEYIGEQVEVRGSVRPSQDGSTTHMQVTEVTVLSASSAESEESSMSSSSSSMESSAAVSSSKATVSSSKSSVAAAQSSSDSSSSDVMIRDLEAAIALMAKQDYAGSLWTQQYCTGHIAFCIPAHKNWYYKSFGATTSTLWHVEFGMESIDTLGSGPIVLNLVDGSVEAAGGSDGEVQSKGEDVIGFKSWNDGTHFELIADARLRTAVSYMLSNITPYTPAQ